MNKLICVAIVSSLALVGCDSKAQDGSSVSMDVGNPDSANVLIIEQGYEAVAPVVMPATNNNQGTEVEGVSSDDVMVSPVSTDSSAQVAPVVTSTGTSVNIEESVTPNSYDFEETETNN